MFWHIGVHDVQEWDEARNAINASEMLHNGDYLNLYFEHKPDSWNAKPPLMIWLIVACYKLFGQNELALRLPAALSTLGFFIYFFRLISKIDSIKASFFSCLVLLSCKAVIGFHVGLGGDFDALLLLQLTASAYYFVCFIDDENKNHLYLAAICTGLAFYTKGPAGLVYLPSFLLYALCRQKLKWMMTNYATWVSLLIVLAIAGSWIVLQAYYGSKTVSADTHYGTSNSLQVLFWHDLVRRFTDTGFEHEKQARDYFFFFTTMDSRLNLWNYIFYLVVASGLWIAYKKKLPVFSILKQQPAIAFSIIMILPLALVLSLAANQHDWYLAPVWGFVAYLIVRGILYWSSKWKPALYLSGVLFLFVFCRHFYYIHTLSASLHTQMQANKQILQSGDKIVYLGQPYQNILTYLYWMDKETARIDAIDQVKAYTGQIIVLYKETMTEPMSMLIEPITVIDGMQIGRIK